jgi:hypothetical protein
MIDTILPCRAPGRWRIIRRNRFNGQVVTQIENLFVHELNELYEAMTGKVPTCH